MGRAEECGCRQMPYQREAEIVLTAWREAERKLANVVPGSDEEEATIADLARYRDEYQRLIRAAREHMRPEPPPFPEVADSEASEASGRG
jgi:hypothetical protein